MLNLHKTKDKQEIPRDTRVGESKNKAPSLVLKYLSRSRMELLLPRLPWQQTGTYMTFVSLDMFVLTRNCISSQSVPRGQASSGLYTYYLLLLVLNKINYVAQLIRNFLFVSILFFILC